MKRTSKLSFRIPGRKGSSSKEHAYQAPPPVPKASSGNLSKAEQILGTGTAEIEDWRAPGLRPSRTRISIPETSHSMSDDGVNHDQWDKESGVFGRQPGVGGGVSSYALGQHFGEERFTETSSTTRRLRNEDSTSTLKSHYDRQKLPVAITQQTSASSARDLALRKGLAPVVQRSPTLQIDPMDSWDQAGQGLSNMSENHARTPERKNSMRVGLSSLFHRSERRLSSVSPNSFDSAEQTTSLRNRLVKAASRESLQPHLARTSSPKSRDHRDQVQDQTNGGSTYSSHDHYEKSTRNAHMNSIPESNIPGVFNLFPTISEKSHGQQPDSFDSEKRESYRRLEDLHSRPGEKDAYSWRNVRSNINGDFRSSMISQSTGHSSLGISSAGSISSHNTKTSRQTGGSVFSSADLHQSSVLSLSSDSEEDLSDPEPLKSRDSGPIGKAPSPAESEIIPPAPQHRSSSTKSSIRRSPSLKNSSTKKGAAQSSSFLTIPESTGGLSNWPMPPKITRQNSINSQDSRSASSHRKSSTPSKNSVQQQPTPPLSPKETDAETASILTTSSGRMMQVSRREEALLEALRQKRARMRETKILEEHEAKRGGYDSSPMLAADRISSRFSKASSTDTIRPDTERVPLFLDPPIMKGVKLGYGNEHRSGNGNGDGHEVRNDHRQPSPDLSDFLNFETDDEDTPTNSRGVSRVDIERNHRFEEPHLQRSGIPSQMDPRFSTSLGDGMQRKGNKGKGGPYREEPEYWKSEVL
ncbi:hypothetical protein DSL72_009167 [Monilinia vaccinii-corymbosi]|uniref:Uncharacterized protein n=1 Tax=Monilinia vaccinii-corymbosi TaxID=61207 RepID=A0A8A3PQB8_9HELO|nr:hypothetical protein DSL72_009167 [Monilinia vaccinii-corymbosi]